MRSRLTRLTGFEALGNQYIMARTGGASLSCKQLLQQRMR
jgi:hypothetical protein